MARPTSPLEKLQAKNLDLRQYAQRAQIDGGLLGKMDATGKVKPGDIKTLNRKLEIMMDQSIRGGGRPDSRYRGGGGWLGSVEDIPNNMVRRLATRPSMNMTFFDDILGRQKVHNNLVKSGKPGIENPMNQMNPVDVDHDFAIKGKSNGERVVSGLNNDMNTSLLDSDYNRSVKSDNMGPDFSNNKYKYNKSTGEIEGYSKGGERLPKHQGGFIDLRLLKDLGKVGLIGGAEMALNYLAPDNPLAQARDRGDELTGQLFGTSLSEGIAGIEYPNLRAAGHLGAGILVDPLLTAAGAGANMGDRMYNEWNGTNKKSKFKRGKGLGGRLKRGLING